MFSVVLTTFKDKEEAKRISKILLDKKIAACIQLKEVESLYIWNNEFCEDIEIQAVIKTRKSLVGRVEDEIIKHHSYDVPQVVELKIDSGSKEYLDWILTQTES